MIERYKRIHLPERLLKRRKKFEDKRFAKAVKIIIEY
jgi:hypothetical protein